MSDNYYDELGVEPGASKDQIRDAHRARITDLEAARGKKGVSDKQLQANREETARVRAAWNVLSDPMQRQRYDAQLATPSLDNGGVELVDDDDDTALAAQPTGWRKLLNPAPKPVPGKNGTAASKGAKSSARPGPAPTVELPEGMSLAEPRARGMALAFDLAILVVFYTVISLFLPGLVQSDYKSINTQIDKVNTVHDRQVDVNNAKGAKAKASADKALTKAKKDATDAGVTTLASTPQALQKQADKLSSKIRTTQLITVIAVVVASLLYLVPMTARTGQTLGMRNRGIKVVRVDGTRCTWYPALTRYMIPVLVGLAIPPPIGPILGLGLVLWGYRDKNRQGVHDKLARTLVVAA